MSKEPETCHPPFTILLSCVVIWVRPGRALTNADQVTQTNEIERDSQEGKLKSQLSDGYLVITPVSPLARKLRFFFEGRARRGITVRNNAK
ncbi:unnamed protein product [Lasius platythorax]|uniref:Uncharacterized protein n=1 Tax=Lasius platythorax TaxID=488582 RepID=A0AAV2NK79_9HYME